MCLKLGSTPTLANNNHLIRIKLNATTTAVSVRTNGTASNWQPRCLRTTPMEMKREPVHPRLISA
jgi:hypothetical protein